MTKQLTFKILEDIARDLSGDEVVFPTFLDITYQVRTALKNPNMTVDQLAKLVGAEPLMSARIIRMANSVALNPSGQRIADVKNAISRVGMEVVRTVSFAVAMEQLIGSKQMQAFEGLSKKLWEHSVYVAALCRVLAVKLARLNGDEAMFTGLVHDLGAFYLLSRASQFPELVADKDSLYGLLVDWHDSIGHALLSALGLPESVLKAVQEHEMEREIHEIKDLADVLYVANKLAETVVCWTETELGNKEHGAAVLESLFDAKTLKDILRESEAEVLSLRQALG